MTHPGLEKAIKLHEAGRLAEAEAAYRAFIEQNPSHAGALFRLAVLARHTGRPQLTVELLQRVLRYAPQFTEGYNELSVLLRELGRFDEAMAAAREAIRAAPAMAKPHINLGNVLTDIGRFDEGIACYRDAIRLAPDLAEGHGNLGMALVATGKLDEAAESLREAIRLKPEIVEGHMNLGNALLGLGEVEAAAAAYRRGMEIDPSHADVHANLLLAMNYLPEINPQEMAAEHRRWGERHAEPLRDKWMAFTNDRSTERPLRVGYVSPDFRRHSVCYFFIPLLEHRNRQMVTTICYSSVPRGDDLTEWVRKSCDGWREVVGMTDEDLARLIRFDEIDILVDLSGHTSANRLEVFARRPAPIQVSYLGYPNTTGMSAMDYRLTDALADPPGATELLHTEKLWRLPKCAWCYRPLERSPEVVPREGGPIVFGCFNAQTKMNRQNIAIWAEILRQAPESRLLLKSAGAGQATARRKMMAQLEAAGIPPQRVETVGRMDDPIEHLKTYHRVDIALDTFPYGGTTTTCEAMWMGVPVVTLAGETHVSRVGVSLLTNVGLSELIARDPTAYIAIAVGLAKSPTEAAKLRSELRGRMRSSTLMDGRRFTGEIEGAYREMWRAWCAEQKREPLVAAVEVLQKGIGDHQSGRFFEAEKEYRRVLAGDPTNADALHLLGTLAGNIGHGEAGIRLLRRAIDIRPEYCEPYRNLGALLAGQGRFDEAIAAYRKIFETRPEYAEAHNDLGKVFLAAGRNEEAVTEHAEALRLRPEFADAQKALGDGLRRLGRYEESISAYSKAVAMKPDWAEAHAGLGESLLAANRLEKAAAEFLWATQLKPSLAEAHFGLGNALRGCGQPSAAANAYSAAIAANPNFALAYYKLGQTLEDARQFDEAAAAYQRAVQIDQRLAAAWRAWGELLQRQGKVEEARECFGRM
jgi:predicted O-linked N-acetylglucosamine transferase (SPINDLY family)